MYAGFVARSAGKELDLPILIFACPPGAVEVGVPLEFDEGSAAAELVCRPFMLLIQSPPDPERREWGESGYRRRFGAGSSWGGRVDPAAVYLQQQV